MDVKSLFDILDIHLPPTNRVEANYWKCKYFESIRELTNANKGINRLRKKLDFVKSNSKTNN